MFKRMNVKIGIFEIWKLNLEDEVLRNNNNNNNNN